MWERHSGLVQIPGATINCYKCSEVYTLTTKVLQCVWRNNWDGWHGDRRHCLALHLHWNVLHTRPLELSKYSTKSQPSLCFMSVKLGLWTWRTTERPINVLKTVEVSITAVSAHSRSLLLSRIRFCGLQVFWKSAFCRLERRRDHLQSKNMFLFYVLYQHGNWAPSLELWPVKQAVCIQPGQQKALCVLMVRLVSALWRMKSFQVVFESTTLHHRIYEIIAVYWEKEVCGNIGMLCSSKERRTDTRLMKKSLLVM